MNFRRGIGRDEPEINLIPFIDVLLVIIIFLMMTTTYSKTAGIEVNLPTASAQNVIPPDEIVVSVTAEGAVVVDGVRISPAGTNQPDVSAITNALKTAAAKRSSGKTPVVSIHADAKATHQRVVDVMQAANQASLSQISFTTRSGS